MNRFSYFVLALGALACTPPPDVTVPSAPFGLQIPSGSNGSNRVIQVRGSSESDVTVQLFVDGACGGEPAVSGAAEAFQGGGLTVTVSANQVTQLTARAVRGDAVSPCSLPVSFTHDDVAPSAPVLVSSMATSTAPALRVRVDGTTEAGTQVFVFANASCTTGDERAAAVTSTQFTVELGATPNATTEFSALAIDAAGNRSACSSSIRFTHDGQPPAAPMLNALGGPSSNAMPTLTGTAEAGSTLRFFSDAACTVALPGIATANMAGAFSAQLTVPRNTSTTIRAAAVDASLNVSPCSSGVSYVHDDIPPALPVFVASTPTSPSRTAMSFQVPVTAEAGATVELFAVAGCTGTPSSTQPAPATFSVNVTANTRQVLSARARDAAGNLSQCASGAVEHDDVAPTVALWTGSVPASPTNQTPNFSLSGTGEAGATATLYRSGDCTTFATTATVSGTGGFVFMRSISNNTTQPFTVTLTDAAGNVSACSAPFVLTQDNIAPIMPVIWGTLPPSPSSSTEPFRIAGVAEVGSDVRLYSSSTCSGLPNSSTTVTERINGSANQGHFSASTTPMIGGTLQLYAVAVDAAGNTSPCSTTSASYAQRATSAWSEEATVGTVQQADGGAFMLPNVVLLPNGDSVAVWIRSQLLTSGVQTSTFSSGSWSTPSEFASTGSLVQAPNVVSDASGTTLAAWTQSDTTWAARRAGGTWAAAENMGTTSYGRTPAVALDGSGNGLFASERFVTSTVRILARRSTGAAWGPESTVSDANYSSFSPRTVLAPSGRAVVVYARTRGSGRAPPDEIFSVTGEVATGWGTPAQRSGAMISREDIALDMTSSGDALAAWLQYPTYLAPMTPMVAQSTGTTWTSASALTATTTNRAGLGARSLTNGEAMAAWLTSTGAVTVARRSTAGVWGTGTAVPGATNAYELRLAAEPGGRAALVWATGDSSNPVSKQFWFSSLVSGAWTAPQLLDVGCTSNDRAALTIDAQGRMVAVWTRTNNTDSRLMARRLE